MVQETGRGVVGGERVKGETMKFEKFEDIIAWQKARELTREVYAHNLPNGNLTICRMKNQQFAECELTATKEI